MTLKYKMKAQLPILISRKSEIQNSLNFYQNDIFMKTSEKLLQQKTQCVAYYSKQTSLRTRKTTSEIVDEVINNVKILQDKSLFKGNKLLTNT